MSDLIARLEAATEGRRELDAEIARLTGLLVYEKDPFWLAVPSEMEEGMQSLIPVPFFTSSLDAALTLVPERNYILMERYSDGWYATVKYRSTETGESIGQQKPAALALCIAALRAREKPE